MLKCVLSLVCIAACCSALESEPSQSESGMMPPPLFSSAPALIAQEQLFRKMADVYLGLQIASSFQSMGHIDYQKGQLILQNKGDRLAILEENANLEEDDEEAYDAVGRSSGGKYASNLYMEEDEDEKDAEEDEDDDDDVSLLELKSQFTPFGGMGLMGGMMPMMGMGMGMAGMGMGMGGYGQHPSHTASRDELEHSGAVAKFSALKAMHIQFYLAGSDVEKSYWVNKIVAMVLPPQLSIFKLYKTYLNTMALSLAFQFHDSFTMEAYLDDFNDRWGSGTGTSSQMSEAMAEQTVYSHWYTLAMIKYQLFAINMYEKMMFGQILAQTQPAQTQAYGAASYLELDAEPSTSQFTGFAGMPFGGMLQYYQVMLRYYSIMLEMQLASAGLMVANTKVTGLHGQDVSESTSKMALQMEHQYLPMLYANWGSTNQMKYYIDYYGIMMDMFAPQMAVAQAADRAENVFQNLVQTDSPSLTPAQESPAAPQ